jgi:hypothetical protein
MVRVHSGLPFQRFISIAGDTSMSGWAKILVSQIIELKQPALETAVIA